MDAGLRDWPVPVSKLHARWRPLMAGTGLAVLPISSLAHTRERPIPATLWSAWNLDVSVLTVLVITTWLYLRGVQRLWERGGTGVGIRRWQVATWGGAQTVIFLALISPLDALGGALFSAHMVQHMLLMLVGPLLLAASNPYLAFLWALPRDSRKRLTQWWRRHRRLQTVVRLLAQPLVVFSLFALGLWIWHLPALYDLALRSDLAHRLEHITFFGVSVLMWQAVLETGRRRGMRHQMAVLMLFGAMIQSGALGAILTFARRPLFDGHAPYVSAWGLTRLEDQQLAGVIMWIPMGTWLACAAFVLLAQWIGQAERNSTAGSPPLRERSTVAVSQQERGVGHEAVALTHR